MDPKNMPSSGFRFNKIILLESSFSRAANISLDESKKKSNLDVSIEKNFGDDNVQITVTILFEKIFDDVVEVGSSIKMLGVFEQYGEVELKKEHFADVNGPAIMFPFIREHLASLSMKAGIGPILLPPINFTKKK